MIIFACVCLGKGREVGRRCKGTEVFEIQASPSVLAVPGFNNARGWDSYWTIRPASPRAGGLAFISVCGQGQRHGGQHTGWLMSNWEACLCAILGHALGWPWVCWGRPHPSWSLGQGQEAISSLSPLLVPPSGVRVLFPPSKLPPTPPSLK